MGGAEAAITITFGAGVVIGLSNVGGRTGHGYNGGMPSVLTSSARTTLLAAARLTLQTYVKTLRIPDLELHAPIVSEPGGAFVTLWLRGQVRGCVGLLGSGSPLYRNIMALTVAAADDSRFISIGAEELHQVRIEIAVMSALEPLTGLEEIDIGRTGLAIEGEPPLVILPEVALECGWGPEELLGNLCERAELPPAAWRSVGSILHFTTVTFSEDNP